MGGGYHGGFGHTFGAQVQEMNLVVTRPICIEGNEVIIEMPVGSPAKESGQLNEFSSPTMITLTIVGDSHVPVKFWYGYLVDLLSDPVGDLNEWRGFTRDFYRRMGAFSKRTHTAVVNPGEYLQDISAYENRVFRYKNTMAVLDEIHNLFSFACNIQKAIRITID